jgi:hypothetical protein
MGSFLHGSSASEVFGSGCDKIGVMTTPRTDADKAFEAFRRTGDADALAVVYDELAPGLLRLALKLLGDASVAEDVSLRGLATSCAIMALRLT